MFMDVELAAKKGASVVVSFVLDVVLVEKSSKVNFWLTAGTAELEDGLDVMDAGIVLLEGNVNLGVSLLRVELKVVNLLVVDDKIGMVDSLLEADVNALLVVDDEVDTVTNLLEMDIVDDLDRVLVLTEDLAVLEAHAFVFGVYNGPCGGYALVDAVSEALVVFF